MSSGRYSLLNEHTEKLDEGGRTARESRYLIDQLAKARQTTNTPWHWQAIDNLIEQLEGGE